MVSLNTGSTAKSSAPHLTVSSTLVASSNAISASPATPYHSITLPCLTLQFHTIADDVALVRGERVPQVCFGYALVGQHVPRRRRVTAREKRLLAAQPVSCSACQRASPLDRIANCFRFWVAYCDSKLHGNT